MKKYIALVIIFFLFIISCKKSSNNTPPVTPLAIGQSYQGGKIAYIDGSGIHGLISSSLDQSTGVQWYNGSFVLTGASGIVIGTGSANTSSIITTQGNTGSYAAKLCRDYNGGGYTDWHLPSNDEATLLFVNKTLIGGFSNMDYWTSTELLNNSAWHIHFGTGTLYSTLGQKNLLYYVRAVRYF